MRIIQCSTNPPKTFRELRQEAADAGEHHHRRYICEKCGNSETCRCSAPKIEVVGICDFCAEGIPNDGRDRLQESVSRFMDSLRARKKPEPESKVCPKCGGKVRIRSNHEDTDIEELVWRCLDCRHEIPA